MLIPKLLSSPFFGCHFLGRLLIAETENQSNGESDIRWGKVEIFTLNPYILEQ